MSESTESLKKKVCVTVFLDELFEEVYDEDHRDALVSDTRAKAEGEVITLEMSRRGPPRGDLDIHEKVDYPESDGTPNPSLARPRKHRRESKFSKNHYDSFKNELDKYECVSRVKSEDRSREAIEFTLSDSEFDADECLNLSGGKTCENSCVSGLSELSEDGFLSDPVPSTVVISCKKANESGSEMNSHVECATFYCDRSTQVDGEKEGDEADGKVASENAAKASPEAEDCKAGDDDLTWKKTQKEIQLILANTKSKYREKEAGQDVESPRDPKTISGECGKTEGKATPAAPLPNFGCLYPNAAPDSNESYVRNFSDSYTCVFPHRTDGQTPEVKRVWTEGFESDLSEVDCIARSTPADFCPVANEPLLCYTIRITCQEQSLEKKEGGPDVDSVKPPSADPFESTGPQETPYGTVSSLKGKEEDRGGVDKEGDWQREVKTDGPPAGGRNKNFAEGDTFERSDSRVASPEVKRKDLIGDEIFKSVDDAGVVKNREIVVNNAEIQTVLKEEEPPREPGVDGPRAPEALTKKITEVFVKSQDESEGRSITDAESETIFAESEHFCGESDDSLIGGADESSTSCAQPALQNVRVVEFEDKLSRSKMVKRIKTVEFQSDGSVSDMKNISTEVILVCENISNRDVCLEAWQTSMSTLKSLTEMGQCYLKDSKDSSMYLIEIPLHFTRLRKEKVSDAD